MPHTYDDPSIPAKDLDFDQFKVRLVKVAMAAAEEHGWCGVVQDLLVDDLGLADYYPPKVIVQRQDTPDQPWFAYLTYDQGNEDYCIKEAQRLWNWTLENDRRPMRPFVHSVTVTKEADLDAVLADLRERQAKIGQTPEITDLWPRYRVIMSKAGSDGEMIGEPLWDCLAHEEQKQLQELNAS